MKQGRKAIHLLLVIALAITLSGCSGTWDKLHDSLNDYIRAIEEDIPDNLRLTIYYTDPNILTRKPLSAEDLVRFSETKEIVVHSGELAVQSELLKKLNSSNLRRVEETSDMNARVYYVFEMGNYRILDVVISEIHGTVFVNGFEVEDDPIFYELITPFLTEEAHETLGF